MNIIAKILRGGGNSLKLRVKSEEVRVGGSSSSWRLRSLFSFILSVALLFGASGARATAISYHQVMGTQNATSISIDGLASDIEIGYEPQLAFPGKTLDEINRCTLITELYGGNEDNTVTVRATAWGIYPQRHKTNGSVDKLAYQFGTSDGDLAKAVVLVLTNGEGGVYVQKFGWCYHSNKTYCNRRMYGLDNSGNPSFDKAQDKPTGTGTSGGYKAWGLRIHGVKVVPYPGLAFPGVTLEGIKDCAFVAGYRLGDMLNTPLTNTWAAFKTCWTNPSNGKLEKIVMQFESSESKKTAIIQLVDGEGGVYASQPCCTYNGTADVQKFSIDENGNVLKLDGFSGDALDSTNPDKEGTYSVSEFFAISQCIPKYPAKTKVFSDPTKTLTLNDIKEGAFRGRLCGGFVDKKELLYAAEPNTPAYHKKIYEDDGGNVTNIIVEYQEKEGTYVKCAVVSFQNGEDGVCASTILSPNKRYATPGADDTILYTGQEWGSGTIADSYTAKGYGVCDLHVWLPIVVQEGETLYIEGSSYAPSVLNNGTIVKTGNGTLTIPFNNDSTGVIIVNNGTLKVASQTGSGTAHTVRVKSGATFDMNGYAVKTASVTLEDGATLKNDSKMIDNATHQTTNLILDGDATVNAVKFFGLRGSSDSAATTLNIGEHTLTVEGSGFWLVNTTIEGSGEIVANGVLSVPNGSSSGENCTLTIASGGTLHGNGTLSVKNFTNNGTISNKAMLTVTGTLTSANDIPKLTLASGATIKATGTAQVVSTEFSASGTITVDALEIDAQTLKAAGETGIPVLTVPATFNPSFVERNVVNSVVNGVRAKWRTDEGGNTKTLYIARSSGLVVIIR